MDERKCYLLDSSCSLNSDPDTVAWLLKAGANPNWLGQTTGAFPASFVSFLGKFMYNTWIWLLNLDILDIFLKHGLDLETCVMVALNLGKDLNWQ